MAGRRGYNEPLSNGLGEAGVPCDSGGRYDSESDARKNYVSFRAGISDPIEDNDSKAGGRDGDVADRDRGWGIPDNNMDRMRGIHHNDILQARSADHI